MSINITAINGHKPLFDYEAFETSFNQLVSGTALDAQVFLTNYLVHKCGFQKDQLYTW